MKFNFIIKLFFNVIWSLKILFIKKFAFSLTKILISILVCVSVRNIDEGLGIET